MEWLRLYNEIIDDPKVQGLPGDPFKGWINFLAIASRNSPRGQLPPLSQLAFILHASLQDAEALCTRLVERGLLDSRDGRLVIHNWAQRQPTHDYSTPRVRRFRKKRSRNNETVETVETVKRRREERRSDENRGEKEEQRSLSLAFSGAHLSVSQQQDGVLAAAFPWVERQAEYRRMDSWLEANPKKRPKTFTKFTHNWMSRIDPPPVNGGTNGRTRTPRDYRTARNAVAAIPGKYANIVKTVVPDV